MNNKLGYSIDKGSFNFIDTIKNLMNGGGKLGSHQYQYIYNLYVFLYFFTRHKIFF